MPVRILHITYSGAGGTGELAVQLSRHADRRCFQPAVCFFGVEPLWTSFRERLEAANLEWSYVPLCSRPRSVWNLFRECARMRPDLVVAHGPAQAAVFPLLRMSRPRVKCVVVFHGPPSLVQSIPGRLRWLPALAAAHRVVCVGPHLSRLVTKNLHCEAMVIRNGVEIPELPLQTVTGELLMVASLSPSKDHATLLEAAARLAQRGIGFRLVLVGDGLLRNFLECRVRELGLGDRVEFLGCLSPEEKFRRLSQAAIFVYATHGEGSPLAVLEAMAAGLPIVASRVAGIPEGFKDERTAFLVPPRNPAALAGALATLLARPEEAARLGRAARQVARQQFSLAACVRAYETLFDSLLEPACIPTGSVSCTSRP